MSTNMALKLNSTSEALLRSKKEQQSFMLRTDENSHYVNQRLAQSFPSVDMSGVILNKSEPHSAVMCKSPLDKVRTGKRERAEQMGILSNDDSFSINQSFPKSTHNTHRNTFMSTKQFSSSLTGINDVSFSRPVSRGSFGRPSTPATKVAASTHLNNSMDQSLNQSWRFYQYTSDSSFSFEKKYTPVTNPCKAIITINARTTEILIANDLAAEMFGITEEVLIGKKLSELLKVKHKHQGSLQELDIDPETGDVVKIAGKIMEVVHADSVPLTVSVWTSHIQSEQGNKCVVVMEPVQKLVAEITVSPEGIVKDCNENFLGLYGFAKPADVEGQKITRFLPTIKLPLDIHGIMQDEEKQTTTGVSKMGVSFPVSLRLSCQEGDGSNLVITLWVFTSISGLIMVSPSGCISAINDNFSKFLCGYNSMDLIGRHISSVLPDLTCNPGDIGSAELLDSGSMPISIFDEDDSEDLPSPVKSPSVDSKQIDTAELIKEASENIKNMGLSPLPPSLPQFLERSNTDDLLVPGNQVKKPDEELLPDHNPAAENVCESCQMYHEYSKLECGEIKDSSPCSESKTLGTSCNEQLTSTPSRKMDTEARAVEDYLLADGCYSSRIVHKNGSTIGVLLQSKRLELPSGMMVNCLWVSQDPEQLGEAARNLMYLTSASSFSHSMNSTKHLELSVHADNELEESVQDPDDNLDFPPADGPFKESYKTTLAVGKGAFGFVKLATRRADRKDFVVKFIRKSKVLKDSWLDDEEFGRVPLEISLLSKLDHPNIVQLVDVFENKDYFQLVMEKHGSGIDLFEFIEKNPNMDEKLASYIFRQVVEAVAYLHDLSILHRDIKDENIILNEFFTIKLIDFGSASFLQTGKLFSTFCGTVEYCSPEVLQGNKYRGPELEVWSMGVTLFTLIFGENPFYDVEETIEAVLKPPFMVSPALMQLIQWMLHADPLFRARIRDIKKHKWITQPVDISKYAWEDVLPNYEFKGNVAADNRPDPLQSSDDEVEGSRSDASSSDDDSQSKVRLEMEKYLNQPS